MPNSAIHNGISPTCRLALQVFLCKFVEETTIDMSCIKPPISIRDILGKPLAIPNYQRPYKWKWKHVLNLISDVEHEQKKTIPDNSDYRYRIGSVILHQEEDVENIVDGQQRLLSIGLILSVVAPEFASGVCLFRREFDNPITLDNLSYNREQVVEFFRHYTNEEKEAFAGFLLDKCEVIVIEAGNISEAFQLFDSQNARGKSLDPADLLKAYHLRVMGDEHEKRMCVQRWEDAIDRKVLYPVLSENIYRCRRWMRRDYSAYEFSKEVIDEFKGVNVDISLESGVKYPYVQGLYVMSRLDSFTIDEPIVNGARFFDYVDHYVSIYERLFPEIGDNRSMKKEEVRDKKNIKPPDLVRMNCFYSPRMHRTGDRRLRNALYCILMCYYDKFGDVDYQDFFDVVYRFVYHFRLKQSRISMQSIRTLILDQANNPFVWIADSYQPYPSELRRMLPLGDPFTVDDLNSNVRNG